MCNCIKFMEKYSCKSIWENNSIIVWADKDDNNPTQEFESSESDE